MCGIFLYYVNDFIQGTVQTLVLFWILKGSSYYTITSNILIAYVNADNEENAIEKNLFCKKVSVEIICVIDKFKKYIKQNVYF